MKLRAAYIDHSYHKVTRSTRFFMDLLATGFDVDQFWDESWNNGPAADLGKIAEGEYDAVIFFQTVYPPYVIDMLNCDNIMFIPMYDNVHHLDDSFWLQYRGRARFISFSKTLHDRLSRLGLESMHIQYFMDPHASSETSDFTSLRGFFWQRQQDVTWGTVRRLIQKADFSRFLLHGAVDPGFKLSVPTKRDMKKYNITISTWFQSRKDYDAVLRDSNVFFASRHHEGIGMSFIEAMSLGQCVVAPDTPTMNEYITHGETGLLYDIRRIRPLDFTNAEAMGRRAREYCREGFLRWNKQKDDLMDYIHPSGPKGRHGARLKKSARRGARERGKLSALYAAFQHQLAESERTNRENERLRAELKNIECSYSFRIGCLVLMPVKRMLHFFRKFFLGHL